VEQLAILKNWERAKLAIRECKDIDEAKDIRDKAQALKVYAQQARESLEVQNNIAEIKIRAERRIGEFSRELETQQGGETRFGTHHYGENRTKTQVLKDVGIDIAHALDAERKMGETLLETDRAKGARLEGKNIGGTPIQPPKDGTPTLAEIGVTKHGVSYD